MVWFACGVGVGFFCGFAFATKVIDWAIKSGRIEVYSKTDDL